MHTFAAAGGAANQIGENANRSMRPVVSLDNLKYGEIFGLFSNEKGGEEQEKMVERMR